MDMSPAAQIEKMLRDRTVGSHAKKMSASRKHHSRVFGSTALCDECGDGWAGEEIVHGIPMMLCSYCYSKTL